ncbi:MAG: thiamine-phosphate kinase [Saprospiraceae bacterium]|nr:thiamine-phosphate kinase [Saprospiraceae bacterium]
MSDQQDQPIRTEISELGEFALIKRLSENFPILKNSTLKGIGDDAAVIQYENAATVVSTDMMLEGIHFDLAYFPLKHLGYKAVISNLSDIYAMNAMPEQITVSIAASNRFSVEALELLYEGIRHACKEYDVDLVGGDTCSSLRGLVISITAIGKQSPEKIAYRSGAKPGDYLFVSGELGAAYLGLQLLEREKQIFLEDQSMQPELEDQKQLIGKFIKPEARKDVVLWLEKAEVVPHAMIDLSDGLSSDLMHLCEQSKIGAEIQENLIPISEESKLMALKFNMDPYTCALNGGEDYELLIAVDPIEAKKIQYLPGFYYIGECKEKDFGIQLKTNSGNLHKMKAQGWVHF